MHTIALQKIYKEEIYREEWPKPKPAQTQRKPLPNLHMVRADRGG